MTGKDYIDNTLYDIGKIQVLTTDTNLRTIVLGWANRVIKHISASEGHWRWLEKTASFDTVASQMTYDLPTDMDLSGHKVYSLRQKDSPVKLIQMNQRRFDELEPNPTAEGNPYWYVPWGNTIRLYPIPSAVITMYLRYIKTVTALTDSAASTTDIPDKFDEVILSGIKVHAFRMFPEWGNSAEQVALFENGIMQMKRDNFVELDSDDLSSRHYAENIIKEPYTFNPENM